MIIFLNKSTNGFWKWVCKFATKLIVWDASGVTKLTVLGYKRMEVGFALLARNQTLKNNVATSELCIWAHFQQPNTPLIVLSIFI